MVLLSRAYIISFVVSKLGVIAIAASGKAGTLPGCMIEK